MSLGSSQARAQQVVKALASKILPQLCGINRPRTRFLSVSEAKRLLKAMPQDFRQLARGALYTGLRLGELLALTGSDFGDGVKKTLSVVRTRAIECETAQTCNRS